MVGEGVGRERELASSNGSPLHLLGRCMNVAHSAYLHTHCKFLSISLDRGGLLHVFYYPSRSCCDYHSKHMTPAGTPRCDRVSLALPCSPCGHETTHGRAAL